MVKPEKLLEALGVVPTAEPDAKLAKRMKRLAHRISSHFESCTHCQLAGPITAQTMCEDGLRLITALSRAAEHGQGRVRIVDNDDA